MELELPDGTILDAPDDADPRVVVRGYRTAVLKQQNPGEYDPQSQQFKDRYGPETGAGTAFFSGVQRVASGAGNMLSKMTPSGPLAGVIQAMQANEGVGDEAIRRRDELEKPLVENHPVARAGGEMAGAVALTAPLGGAGAPSTGQSLLSRTLAHPTTRAALEGAVGGSTVADVDEQGSEALKGAVLSGTMERLFAGGGRALKGLIQKSDSAKALQQLAGQQGEDIFIPVAQAAGDQDIPTRFGKVLYQEGISLVPGARSQINRQAEEAADKFRELALKEATPSGVKLPEAPGRNVQESVASIRAGFDSAYDNTIRSLTYYIPRDLRTRLNVAIKTRVPHVDSETSDKAMNTVRGLLRRFSGPGGRVEGANLLIARDEMRRAVDKAPDFEKDAFQAASDVLDDIILKRLRGKGLADQFADLEEPARHLKGIQAAASAARPLSGKFTPAQLARHAKDPTQLDLAQTANAVMKNSATGTSFAGRNLLSLIGLGGSFVAGGPAGPATILAGGNLLATRTAQRALMGDTRAQHEIVKLLEQHPEMAYQVELALRQAAATGGDDGHDQISN